MSTARRDASMTLLREVMERPLDPGYAAAAARREATRADPPGPAARRTARRRLLVTLVAACVVGTLLTAAVLDLRLPGAATDARDALLREVDERTAAADAMARRVEQLRADVEAAQVQALADDDAGVLDVVQRLALEAGEVPVTGPGMVVTLDDASQARDPLSGDPRQDGEESDRVMDLDLQIVVNGLWAAGAEAVAVNGQRLTSLSAIRGAGSAILVGFRPLARPYRIQAVGDAAELQTRFAASAAGGYLAFVEENVGLRVATEGVESLDLPAAGPLRVRHATTPSREATP
jgi:uncharacterized protein YlxW (UPF0749 family)